jgi:hypothetical protein
VSDVRYPLIPYFPAKPASGDAVNFKALTKTTKKPPGPISASFLLFSAALLLYERISFISHPLPSLTQAVKIAKVKNFFLLFAT